MTLDDAQAAVLVEPPAPVLPLVPDEWIVAFEPKTSIWWGRFLEPGFGHCFAFGWTPAGWLYVEPLTDGTRIGLAESEVVLRWFTAAKIGKLRLLKMRPPRVEVVRPRFAVTCAGCIASVLGLRRYPLTPRGLFWMLRRLGAVEVGRNIDG